MKILKGIFTVFRVIVGIFCILLCVTAVTLAIENKQPLILLEILLLAPISFFALRGLKLSRRERKKVETVSPNIDMPPLFTVTVTSTASPKPMVRIGRARFRRSVFCLPAGIILICFCPMNPLSASSARASALSCWA